MFLHLSVILFTGDGCLVRGDGVGGGGVVVWSGGCHSGGCLVRGVGGECLVRRDGWLSGQRGICYLSPFFRRVENGRSTPPPLQYANTVNARLVRILLESITCFILYISFLCNVDMILQPAFLRLQLVKLGCTISTLT